MTCPFCGHREDKVIDSRESKEGDVIRRRRECLKCERRFTTYERSDEIHYMVIKRDGRREPIAEWQGVDRALEALAATLDEPALDLEARARVYGSLAEAASCVVDAMGQAPLVSELASSLVSRLARQRSTEPWPAKFTSAGPALSSCRMSCLAAASVI